MDMLPVILLLIMMAGAAHGALGFGFPMLSTPILALAYDLQTAVVLTMIPSSVVIILSLYNCRGINIDYEKYYPIILMTTIGSFSGAWLLTWVNPDILKLLLAASILIYLFSAPLKQFISMLSARALLFPAIMGSFAGVIGGATNAVSPVLMMYLLEVTESKKEIIVISNICFLLSKMTQLAILSMHLTTDDLDPLLSGFIVTAASIGLIAGFWLQHRIDETRYRSIIRGILFTFMFTLFFEGGSNLFF
ncbi:hypothetical protein GZ77_03730 [Endozoicomonas montiporae]|uniref:Probable membrane transporter protein n=2 Tax=Endozoicomonas montiporae TaxID=1027273 RepID=A0A081NB70_9GAMM|nr:sulfite exporter TauE/SafE family protein [Endozoicomonas montiporae]AMO56590.1 hypothetical protein EZMO1_2509 [Endozoicomonas montiporae CL-33]KEQ15693.1 hypothetical protein GZ77_03730 [Endozoicomonas montiporae]